MMIGGGLEPSADSGETRRLQKRNACTVAGDRNALSGFAAEQLRRDHFSFDLGSNEKWRAERDSNP